MFNKLVRHVVLISVPMFVLLMVTYRSQVEQADVPLGRSNISESPSNNSNQFKSQPKSDWKVLWNGTVIHQGSQLIDRNYSLLINNPLTCSALTNKTVSFLIVVESYIINFDQRQLIRDTWGLSVLQILGNFKVIFLVGLAPNQEVQGKIDFENMIYEDILQIDVVESFKNLTYKSINMLYWYIQFCPNANYLFKTDDDIYLHIPNLIEMLSTAKLNRSSILCHQNKSRKILRSFNDSKNFAHPLRFKSKQEMQTQMKKKFLKYMIKFDTIPGSLYPEYCSGFGYAINYRVAKLLFEASKTIPYLEIEDVFITGLCRQKSNITIVNSPRLKLRPFIHPIESKCAFENGRVNSNEMNIGDIRKLWTHVNTKGYYCKYTKNNN